MYEFCVQNLKIILDYKERHSEPDPFATPKEFKAKRTVTDLPPSPVIKPLHEYDSPYSGIVLDLWRHRNKDFIIMCHKSKNL